MAAAPAVVHWRRRGLEARVARKRTNAWLRGGAALMMLPLLGSCVAMAVPLVAAGAIARKQLRSREEIVSGLPAANAATLAALPDPAGEAGGLQYQITQLRELPPPSPSDLGAGDPWQQFAAFALGRAIELAKGEHAASALLTPDSVTSFQNRTRPCRTREAAVVVDIDPGSAVFAADGAMTAAPGVAAPLAQLRDAGVIVLWVSQASANDVAAVADALKASGLDPTGRDPILLVRNADERKQVLREEANSTVCVVAIAGDRRSDFDELFDYLRDQRLATAYDGELGNGWFLVPEVFASTVAPAGEDGGG